MNVLEGIDALKNGLMWVGLSALAAIAVGVVGAWLCRGVASATRRLLTVARIIAFAVVSAFCVLRGGAKFLMPLPSTGGTPVVPVVVTQEEIAQGWRLESVTTNEAVSYAMPTNGVEYMPWSLGGGYEMHFPLDLGDDFGFPFGTGVVRRLDVLSGGMVESLPRQRVGGLYHSLMSICAAREYASIVPGVGRFWWAGAARPESAPYQVMLITWENVFGGRDRTGQYNAQIEFHNDGNFITRSNNVERVYRRVLPYDLDNDGLPNDIDPAPEVPLVPSAWNQSEEWAAAAFPSNAAEIAAMGGYAAWAYARGTDPDRRLVSLGLAFDDGSSRPAFLDFSGVPVVADGAAELVFAIDCGAKVPFSLTSGRLGSLAVTATEPSTRLGEGMTTTESSVIQNIFTFPYERSVGDVKLHLDNFRSGWLCRTANVSIDGDEVQHLFPGDTIGVAASVTGCHSNAYLGCTWTGGAGITFSNPHSLTTDVTYASASTVLWATNGIDLVTQFFGYTLTNHVPVTVGTDAEPPLALSLGCQKVFFLNDADFLEGACPSNRPERIRPVALNLTGPVGTNGTARLAVHGGVDPVIFHVVNGVTNRVTSETVFPLAVTNDFEHTASYMVYVSCPNLGTGTITATFTPADGGAPLTDSVTFRCIEPLRKLVTTEKKDGRYVNPSRLVMGTNAVLKVGANGPFSPSEVNWRVVSGPGSVSHTNGWETTAVVQPRTIPVKAFIVDPPMNFAVDAWSDTEVSSRIQSANDIFSQVGLNLALLNCSHIQNKPEYWTLHHAEMATNSAGECFLALSRDAFQLFNTYTSNDCIELYFIGSVVGGGANALWNEFGIGVTRNATPRGFAHEILHAFGLSDCFSYNYQESNGQPVWLYASFYNEQVTRSTLTGQGDWGVETGRGFYEKSDTHGILFEKLLMFGYDAPDAADIPSGEILSLKEYPVSTNDTIRVPIGCEGMKMNEVEVFSK